MNKSIKYLFLENRCVCVNGECIASIANTNVYRDEAVKVDEHGRPGIKNVDSGRCCDKIVNMCLYIEATADICS